MKRSRFSDEEITGVIKEQKAGIPTVEICRKHGIVFGSKAKFGGIDVFDAHKREALEAALAYQVSFNLQNIRVSNN